jgi:hypothetical protein
MHWESDDMHWKQYFGSIGQMKASLAGVGDLAEEDERKFIAIDEEGVTTN